MSHTMATQTKKSNTKTKSNTSATRSLHPVMFEPAAVFNENAAERVRELSEQAVDSGKKAGAAHLSSYEKAVLSGVDAYEQAASGTKLDWVASIVKAQADFTRATTNAYGQAARELVS